MDTSKETSQYHFAIFASIRKISWQIFLQASALTWTPAEAMVDPSGRHATIVSDRFVFMTPLGDVAHRKKAPPKQGQNLPHQPHKIDKFENLHVWRGRQRLSVGQGAGGSITLRNKSVRP